jgi:hypothetical protein
VKDRLESQRVAGPRDLDHWLAPCGAGKRCPQCPASDTLMPWTQWTSMPQAVQLRTSLASSRSRLPFTPAV